MTFYIIILVMEGNGRAAGRARGRAGRGNQENAAKSKRPGEQAPKQALAQQPGRTANGHVTNGHSRKPTTNGRFI